MGTRSVTGRDTPGIFDGDYLLYTTDGYMSAVLTKGPRASFATGVLFSGTSDEKVHAYHTYLSYGSRFSADGDVVTHHVLHCVFPYWVGSDQVRRFVLSPDGTTLTNQTLNPLIIDGEETYSYLTWRRA